VIVSAFLLGKGETVSNPKEKMKSITSFSPATVKKLEVGEVSEELIRETVSEIVSFPDSAHVQEQQISENDWSSFWTVDQSRTIVLSTIA
jgi:hypothetical protein